MKNNAIRPWFKVREGCSTSWPQWTAAGWGCELFERMERNGAKESRITFSRGADDLIRLDAFVMEIDEAGAEVLREYVAAGRIELKVIKDLA